MTAVPFTFGPEFQENMLRLMLNDLSFADKCVQYIEEDYLHSDAHKWLFHEIKDKYGKNKTVPSSVEIEASLSTADKSKRRVLKSFVSKITSKPAEATDFLKEKLTEFAKRTNFAELFQHGQTLYNAGHTEDSYNYVLEAINHLHHITFKEDYIISVQEFEAIRKRAFYQSFISSDVITTGITNLDKILLGGLSKTNGELGVILAEPKKGKSIGLVHMGYMALTSLAGRVAHFVLEGSTEQTTMRYQSRLSGIPYNNIKKNNLEDHEEAKLELIGRRFTDRLEVIPFNSHWDYTTSDVEAKINELIRSGHKPDLIVIDYADLLKPRVSVRDPRHDQREVFRELKRMATMYKIAIWTASQAQRPKVDDDHETILRSSSISESYEKVRIADFVATINQTPSEKDAGILRFHADIYRSNEANVTMTLFCDYSRMIFSYKKLVDVLPSDLAVAAPWKKRGKKIRI